MHSTDYGMSYVDNEAQFRFPIAFQIVFALATMVMMYFLPESPRWLVAHDRSDEARNILTLAFAADVLAKIEQPALKGYLEHCVSDLLSSVPHPYVVNPRLIPNSAFMGSSKPTTLALTEVPSSVCTMADT